MMENKNYIVISVPFCDVTDKYKLVDNINDVPDDYIIWNIGRVNFPLKGYLPLARRRSDDECFIDRNSLIAAPVESEEQALEIMDDPKTLTVKDIKERYKTSKERR